jgi:ribosome-binding ATPase YchF (GTP1/OBG family)
VLYVCNVEEASAAGQRHFRQRSKARAAEEGAVAVVVISQDRGEIAVLPPDRRISWRPRPGGAGPQPLIRAGYDLLGLQTYFTVGPKEARAWTIEKGTKAPQAAGVIHTDFEKGFIRAETIAYDDYVASRAKPARARPASSASKARNMSSPTATWRCSALTTS